MPFTPFHFGPGLAIKAIEPRRFWLTSFMAANVLIDCEVLYYLSQGERPLHRYLHTYIGGLAIGTLSGVLIYFVVENVIRMFRLQRGVTPPETCQRSMSDEEGGSAAVTKRQRRRLIESIAAGMLGGVSHILLDSFMHRDMHPYWPFAEGNSLVGIVNLNGLHIGLAATGFFGLIFWILLADRGDA